MPQFTPITHVKEIPHLAPDAQGWKTAQQFKSRGRVVNGHKLIAKKECPYFLPHRIARVFVGVLATVCSGGCLYFHSKSVQKLIWKSSQSIRFGVLSSQKKKSSSKKKPKPPSSSSRKPKPASHSLSSSSSSVSSSPERRPSFFSPVSKEQNVSPLQLPPITPSWQKATVSQDELNESRIELEQKIIVSEETLHKIRELMPRILNKEQIPGVTYYPAQPVHRVFTLDTERNLIFKIGVAANRMLDRFNNVVYVNAVCKIHRLAQLVIPSARLIPIESHGQNITLFVEQKLDVNPYPEMQAQFYLTYARELDLAVSQLAQLICLTGVSDIEPRNNPVVFSNNPGELPKLALIDLQYLKAPRDGLYGGEKSGRGLIRTISTRFAPQFAQVCAQISKNYSDRSFKRVLREREQELEALNRLNEYHAQRGIKNGDEPLSVDLDQLSFSQQDPELETKLKTLAQEMVGSINQKLKRTSSQNAISGRRKVVIRPKEGLGNQFIDPVSFPAGTPVTQENERFTYTGCIIAKLIEAGALFEVVERHGNEYLIQA